MMLVAERGLVLLGLLSLASGIVGCASSPTRRGLRGPTPGEALWELPTHAYPSQRLYRVKYKGPEGDLSFKLTLYLQDRERYQMRAAARFGRRLWSLMIGADKQALWLDHREKEYCRASDATTLTIVPIAHLPLLALPRFLLGRLPASPATELREDGDRVSYSDGLGQRWSGGLREGRLEWWGLVEEGDFVAWWRGDSRSGVFLDQRAAQEVRWEEVLNEPLAKPPAPVEIPPRYRQATCEDYLQEG